MRNSCHSSSKILINTKSRGRPRDFVSFIDEYIASHGLKRAFIINKANLTNYGYRVLNGTKHTSNRNTILRICVAMGMDLQDTQRALKYYNMRLLDDDLFRDKVIIACIVTEKSLEDIEDVLCKVGEKSIYEELYQIGTKTCTQQANTTRRKHAII